MDRLELIERKILERLKKINKKSSQKYTKIFKILEIKKSKFSAKINKIEEKYIRKEEDKDADLLLDKLE